MSRSHLIALLFVTTTATHASAQVQPIDEAKRARADARDMSPMPSVPPPAVRVPDEARVQRAAPASERRTWDRRENREVERAAVKQTEATIEQSERPAWDANADDGNFTMPVETRTERRETPPVVVAPPVMNSDRGGAGLDRENEYRRDQQQDRNAETERDRRVFDRSEGGVSRQAPAYDPRADDRRLDRNGDGWYDSRDIGTDWERRSEEGWDRARERGGEARGRDYDERGYDDRDSRDQRWDRAWRGDRRYDWQRHRSTNRYLFTAPRYFSPFGAGYRYQQYSTGAYLDSRFYGSRYWLSDPAQYRLPQAYAPYRWVRYYNDVLLVDTRTGYVADTITNFFF